MPRNVIIDERWKPQPYHEIFHEDCYRLKRLPFTPEIAYDIGGNLGCFAGYVKTLWPNTRIVTVEPHPSNFAVLQQAVGGIKGIIPIHAAMATSQPHWVPAIGGESNPGGHTYICKCIGYGPEDLTSIQTAACPFMPLCDIVSLHPPDGPYIVKLDCEGGEECLFEDDASNDVLRRAHFFSAELHFFAAKHREIPEVDRLKPGLLGTHGHVIRAFFDWMYGFCDTHKIEIELLPNSGMLWATKK